VPPGRPRWLAVALALALTALLGVAVDEIVYRPLVRRNSSPLIQLLSSLGTYIIIVNLVLMAYGNEVKVLSAGLQRTYSYGGGVLSEVQIATAAWCAVIFAGLVLLLRLTRLGKLIRAMRDDPDLVAALGVAPQTVRRAVFALGSALAGAAEKSFRGGAEPI
jgi:branched-subunit amino acid ABC-type transport system permease component